MTRRDFLGGVAAVAAMPHVGLAEVVVHDPNLAVFLSDIHCNGKYAGRWVQHQHPILKRYVAEILAMRPLPANVVVFGDFSASCGWKEDFAIAREFVVNHNPIIISRPPSTNIVYYGVDDEIKLETGCSLKEEQQLLQLLQ